MMTRRPAPERKGKPLAHSPAAKASGEACTHVSGVVMRKLSVPRVMMIQRSLTDDTEIGREEPEEDRIPIVMIRIPRP